IFTEIDQGIFRQTPLGTTLQGDHPLSVQPLARLVGDLSWWRSWGSLSHAIMTGEPAIEHAFGMHLFDYLGQHPETASVFNTWMTRFSQMTDPAIVGSYDFSHFKQIVDVGGGHGNLLTTILQTNPALKGVLFDLPEVVSAADLSETAVMDRCEIVGGDFFEALPAGGDAYILKQIIHDWHDNLCIKILRNCHKAMTANGRLLVIDAVIPSDNAPDINKFIDLHMLVLTHGGKERTEAEFKSLFKASGFQITRIISTPTLFKLIEGKRK
ncbi:MAG: methyltransferase, partial [Anaerolineae bacterium]|nr:methyltransferase [Anaerolineae bacterium]